MERRELIRWLVATAGLQSLNALGAADLIALGRDVHRRPLHRAISTRAESPRWRTRSSRKPTGSVRRFWQRGV